MRFKNYGKLILLLATLSFYFSCSNKSTPPPPPAPEAQVSTFAGNASQGFVNATGTAAEFNGIRDMIIDQAGNLYTADVSNYAIRKITPAGVVSTYAGGNGIGFLDGPAATAKFGVIASMTFDQAGNLYVGDQTNLRVRKITPAGVVSTVAGTGAQGYTDGPTATATFSGLDGLAVDASGNIFVSNYYKIRKITPGGDVSTHASSPGGQGFRDGDISDAQFFGLYDLVFDSEGNLIVLDGGNVRIRKITPSGQVSTISGTGFTGYTDGTNGASSAKFNNPKSITLDPQGNIYVADASNNRIRKITPTGATTTIAGNGTAGFAEGDASQAKFNLPHGVAVDQQGNVFVADLINNRIRKITF